MHPDNFAHAARALILIALVSLSPRILAQTQEPNLTGPAGIFNGNISTADAVSTMDLWTENYRRGPIDDIVVPGTVGAYPLKFSRTYNSKDLENWEQNILPSGALGNSMGQYWRHSYSWAVGSWQGGTIANPHSAEGYVFPDGRTIPHPPILDCPAYFGPAPIEEGWNGTNWVMADGGKIHLDGGHGWGYNGGQIDYIVGVAADQVTDPYGLVTTIEHDTSCTNCGKQNRLKKVTEPGGRYLFFTYHDSVPGDPDALGLIKRVEAFDRDAAAPQDRPLGLWVEYHYETNNGRRYLSQIDYSDNSHAYYHWNYSANPVYMDEAQDSHYSQAMRRIKYSNPEGAMSEKNFFGEIVSQATPAPSATPDTKNKKEVRGDGASRILTLS